MASMCVGLNGIFCPHFSRKILVQLYEIYLVDFIGGVLKTLSNFLTVSISINRYFLLRNDKFLEYLTLKLKKKSFIAAIGILIAVFINLDKLLTSVVNADKFLIETYQSYQEFPRRNTFTSSFEHSLHPVFGRKYIRSKEKRWAYFALFCINFILNDFLLFIALCISDLLLLKKFKSNIKKKKMVLNRTNFDKQKQNNSNVRITTIIIASINFFIILRAFEFGMNVWVLKNTIGNSPCDNINKTCTNIYQDGNLFYLISCSYTIIMYFYLNRQFRQTLKESLWKIVCFFDKKNN